LRRAPNHLENFKKKIKKKPKWRRAPKLLETLKKKLKKKQSYWESNLEYYGHTGR